MERKWLTTFLVSMGIFAVVVIFFLWSEGYFKIFLERGVSSHAPLSSSEQGEEGTSLAGVSRGQDKETLEGIELTPLKETSSPASSSPSEEMMIRDINVSLELGQYEKVFQTASSYLSLYPQGKYRIPVMQSVAMALYEQRNFLEALTWCRKALNENIPREYELGLASVVGFVLKDAEKFDPALLSWMEQVYLRHSTENVSALVVGIAYQYLYKNDPTTALAYLQEAKGELALIGRARAYIVLNNYPAAIQEYENFFAFYPESHRKNGILTAFLRQTLYYAKLNENHNPTLALSYYEKLTRFPDTREAEEAILASLRLLRQQKRYKECLAVAKRGLSNSRKDRDPEILFEMAGCYYESGNKEEARRMYEGVVTRYGNHVLASQAKAWLELLSKESSLQE
ncbi:MAG: tetratricopeptide repeat protein [Brevinematales bacterium]|nr:tetratricopeptide repeat protein [Brevinematales bacterium]